MSRPKIVVLGTMCREPLAGMVWLYLNYLLGFARLGFDTYYVEWHGRWVPNPVDAFEDPDSPRVLVGEIMRRVGLANKWICRADHLGPGRTFGDFLPSELSGLYADAEAIVNVTGSHYIEEEQLACPRRVYLETDPGIPQVRLQRHVPEMIRLVQQHTHHFTWAHNLRSPDCRLPSTSLDYVVTRQPVVLDCWDTAAVNPDSCRFTTIARWHKQGKEVAVGDDTYRWSKDHEFRKIIGVPQRTSQPLELALSSISHSDQLLLEQHGWSVVDAVPLSVSLDSYRLFVQRSRGELTIAKDQYARLRTGWFSDRSACYLAAGKPVVTQDTGFGSVLPTGRGLFAFETIDDILAALDAINTDYRMHCEAAREIAHEYFDARKVLSELLSRIGVECGVGCSS